MAYKNSRASLLFVDSQMFCHTRRLPNSKPLTEEFYNFQLLGDDAIPGHIMETFKTERGNLRMDVLWSYVEDMKDTAEGVLCYPRLRKVAHLILTIPHSNAKEERVFSIIRKNKTCFRPNLDAEETLASVVTVKLEWSRSKFQMKS